ncbi:Predicted sugar dehydrogenase TM0325 [hydrothermal vent metagenome]|uniref:Predicted sugar dehydrogenase TM0325 n=1 Tax=hydrothermal vent metagenome TaxID=652676 RepID=A0A1W1D459_9ZZZZ
MKNVLITGANSGIGFATVKLFLQNGYKVFAHYNKNKDNLLKINNKNLVIKKANLLNLDETKELFVSVQNEVEYIDVLINNAALYNPVDNFENLDIENLDEVCTVNVKSPFILSKLYITLMKKFDRGRIINISSIGVKYGGSVNSMAYTISKSALETMTLAFAKEGAKHNILVNALRVGVTNTKIHHLNKSKNMQERIKMIPLQRMAEPMEIAEYIFFLSSEKNSFTTGSIITISGGE